MSPAEGDGGRFVPWLSVGEGGDDGGGQGQPGQHGGNTVSTLVQQLVEAGFVHRGPDPADRRVAVVTLTDAGSRQLADWDRAHQRRIGDALGGLPAADRTAIRAALPALARLVDQLAEQRGQPR